MYRKSLVLLATVVFGLVGCNKEDADLTAPTNVMQQPSSTGVANTGVNNASPVSANTGVGGQVLQAPVNSQAPTTDLQNQIQPTQVAPLSEQQNVVAGSPETQVAPSTTDNNVVVPSTAPVTPNAAVPVASVTSNVDVPLSPTPSVNDQAAPHNVIQNGTQMGDSTPRVVVPVAPSVAAPVASGNVNPVGPVRQVPSYHQQTVDTATSSRVSLRALALVDED